MNNLHSEDRDREDTTVVEYDDHSSDSSDEAEDVRAQTEQTETVLNSHHHAFMLQKFRRLPCAAHKVHLVVNKSINSKRLAFGSAIQKARSFIIKYRKSSKAKGRVQKYHKAQKLEKLNGKNGLNKPNGLAGPHPPFNGKVH